MPVIAIPVCYEAYGGYISAKPKNGGRQCRVMWGDSLNIGPPRGVLHVIRVYMVQFLRDCEFHLEAENHFINALGFEKQRNGFNCGFYVLSTFQRICGGWKDKCMPLTGF